MSQNTENLTELLTSIAGIEELKDVKFLIDSPQEVELRELKTEVRLMAQAIKAGKMQEGVVN